MQVGDLIVDKHRRSRSYPNGTSLGVKTREPGGEAYPNEEYYLMDVQFWRYVECTVAKTK